MSKNLLHENLRAGGAADYTFGIIQFYDTPRQPPKLYRLYTATSLWSSSSCTKSKSFQHYFFTLERRKIIKNLLTFAVYCAII